MKILNLATLFLLLGLVSCGDATSFSGSGASGVTSVGTGDGVTRDPASLTWNWSCESDVQVTQENDTNSDDVSLYGPGPHELNRTKFMGSRIHFQGQACHAKSMKRDILLVIDISSSMTSVSDPLRNGTCGRMDAVRKVIDAAAKSGDARFGIVTFGSFVLDKSTKLFDNQDDLFDDLLAQSRARNIEDIICNGEGDTNYEDGLTAGFDLLKPNAENFRIQELYFVSDGTPVPSTSHGKEVAKVIREHATIATVMLGSDNDSTLRNGIASKDQNGSPLHVRVEESEQLAETLASLADNYIESSELSFVGSGKEGKTTDISKFVDGGSFSFDDIQIGLEDGVDGVDVKLSYKDRHGNSYDQSGKIIWVD